MTSNTFYLTWFFTANDSQSDPFAFKSLPFNSHHHGSSGLYAEDSLLDNLLRDFVEPITDLLFQLVHGDWHGLVDLVLYHSQQEEITGIHFRTGRGPEVPLPGLRGQHFAAKDWIQPVHNNMSLVRLCSILLPDGLVELLQALPPLDERQHLVGQLHIGNKDNILILSYANICCLL